MPETDFDYLIVGQGLAGTTLSLHLLEMGKRVLVVGDSTKPSSSRVAAGIFNPLTGKKLVKTWLADDLFPFANAFYSKMEKEYQCKILHTAPIYRPFRSIEEQNTYLAQTADPGIATYVSTPNNTDLSAYVQAPFGGLEVIQSGWVDLPLFLDKSREYMLKSGSYSEAAFDNSELAVHENVVEWGGKSFGRIIFCQGFEGNSNHFFDWLPFAPVKGQILDIATATPLPEYIVNQGIFIFPTSERIARVGATYSWDPLNWEPTAEATAELEEKLGALLKIPYDLKSVKAGVRPSVKDRRPLIGVHPKYANVCIFNGLGTKGVTLAPFFAKQFAEHLEMGKELNPLVNIQRYFSLYFR